MGKLFREPLLHFLALGALIFLLYGAVAGQDIAENEIFISRGQQENLINTFTRTWQRPPTPLEYQGLLRDYIRQEIAYRQSREMGLDEDDIVIRRRLRQKMEMLAEDVAGLVPPTDEELQAYLDANAADFAIEPRLSVRQVYFSADRRGDQARRDALLALEALPATADNGASVGPGDPLPLPEVLEGSSPSGLARLFGEAFAASLEEVEPGHWQGPVESGFGWHLVYVYDVEPGRQASLGEVRDAVELEVKNLRRKESVDLLYERMAENYRIDIEPLVPESGAGETGQ